MLRSLVGSLPNKPHELDAPLKTRMKEGYNVDPFPTQVLKMLHETTQPSKKISLGEFNDNSGLLEYRRRFYIPDQPPPQGSDCRSPP